MSVQLAFSKKDVSPHGVAVLHYRNRANLYTFMRVDVITGDVKAQDFKPNSKQWMRLNSLNGASELLEAYPCQIVATLCDEVAGWRNALYDCGKMVQELLRITVDYSDCNNISEALRHAEQYPQLAHIAKQLHKGNFVLYQHTMLVAALVAACTYIDNKYLEV